MEYEKLKEVLEKFGLSHNETKAYLTLLRIGGSMAGKIAKEGQMDRASCYDALKKLLKKGLIIYALEANRKMFKAVSPNRLIEILKEKEDEVQEVLPQLLSMFKEEKGRYGVTLYKGYKGMKSVFEDILKESKGKENLVIDSSGQFEKKMPYFFPHFVKGLEKNKIKIRHIVRGENLNASKTTETRYLPKALKESVVATNIYGNKVAILLWTEVPEAIIIENKAASEAYRDYFEILWNSAKK